MVQKNESPFVGRLKIIIADLLLKPFCVEKGERLEYQSGFDTKSEFVTDLCIFEGDFPRVVFELKTSPTTHDVMVYSQKADDHKRIAPQLVYGMVAERGEVVSTKLWKHNRHMDFALYLGGLSDDEITKVMSECVQSYVEESKLREEIAKGKAPYRGLFRKTVHC